LKLLDWLGLDLDFKKELNNILFESQRKSHYEKYVNYLFGNKDAYKCFCKNYMKCEKDCLNSNENKDYNNNTLENKLFTNDYNNDYINYNDSQNNYNYLRLKGNDKNISCFDYMKNKDEKFNTSIFGDFVLFNNFNKEFTGTYKRTIDDSLYGITHVVENRNRINIMKNEIITRRLLLNRKKYLLLPEIQIKNASNKYYENINIDYLKKRTFMPETLINEAYLLGFGKGPEKEYEVLALNNKNKDVMKPEKIMDQVK
jgi:glutamyl/glutaminyl-tRNA synthetase